MVFKIHATNSSLNSRVRTIEEDVAELEIGLSHAYIIPNGVGKVHKL